MKEVDKSGGAKFASLHKIAKPFMFSIKGKTYSSSSLIKVSENVYFTKFILKTSAKIEVCRR